ncbi:MAG: tocopherol cyclase family protein, partial [Crocinitomicaceae bacterium]
EKDWGRSFPIAYFWMQSNHFSKEGVSLKASIAKIPFAKRKFVGFIAGLWLDGKLIRFTTYNASKLIRSFADEKTVEIKMKNPKYILHINANRGETTELASPILGFMDGRVEESMTAVLEVKLIDKKTGKVIFEDKGRNAGLEVAGKIDEIII